MPSARIRSPIAAATWSRGASSSVKRSPDGVEKRRALAPHRLGDQRAVALRSGHGKRGGVELAELEVGELGADLVSEDRAGPDRSPRVRRPLPERRPAARGQDHRPCPDRSCHPSPRRSTVSRRSRAPARRFPPAPRSARPRRPSRRGGRLARGRSGSRPRARCAGRCARPRGQARERRRCPRRSERRSGPATRRRRAPRRPAFARRRAGTARGRRPGCRPRGAQACRRRRAPRRGRPAPSSSSSPGAAFARPGRPACPVSATLIAAWRPAAPAPTTMTGIEPAGRACPSAAPSEGNRSCLAEAPAWQDSARVTLLYTHPSSYGHDTGGHPENAGRIRAIEAALG